MFPKDFMTYEESANSRSTFSIRFFTASTDISLRNVLPRILKISQGSFSNNDERVETDMGPFGMNV